MDLSEIRSGLWRWTARHPEWESGQAVDSPGDWPADVGSVAYRGSDSFTLIDPLVDEGDWSELDDLVEAHGKPVHVLITIPFHERSCAYALERYRGSTEIPAGIDAVPIGRAGETMFWVPAHRALVPGDRILGFGSPRGGLRPCPDSWLGYLDTGITGTELRAELRRLLELPIDLVIVSHGEPVLENGCEALSAALSM